MKKILKAIVENITEALSYLTMGMWTGSGLLIILGLATPQIAILGLLLSWVGLVPMMVHLVVTETLNKLRAPRPI